MTQVSTQEQLRAALLAQEAEIQVIADFDVGTQQTVSYSLLLHSAPGTAVHTISKTAGFSGSLLRVSGGGALTLENLVLDGAAAGSYQENNANRTLVQAAGGSIHLGSGAVLQNNSSYQEGGGLYLSGDPSYVNTLLIDGDAVIRGCNSRTSGGGLTAALRSNDDSVRLAGTARIEENTAANGAGVYLRSYLADVGGSISIGEQVQIRKNQATVNGGGIYCSSFSTGGSASLSLTVEGGADVSSNQAASGGGLYFYSANRQDRLVLTGAVRIAENIVTGNGGGVCLSSPRDGVSLSIQGASITDNQALNGGGVYLRAAAGGDLEVAGQTTISGNEVLGAASGAGGGLWIQNVSGTLTAVFSNAALLSNRAAGNGGGLFFSDSGEAVLRITGSAISQNASGAAGGGLYLIESGSAAGTLEMEGVTVSGNGAASGGGLYLGSRTGALESALDNCTISGNTAKTGSGGGIWSGGANDTLLLRGGTVVTQNSSEAGNGGGVYFNSDDGTLLLSGDARVTYNRADARLTPSGNHGGGICLVPGRMEIRDQAEIAYNRAGSFGGGLSAAEESVVAMSGGSIHDNWSGQEGGGVWNHVSSQFIQTGGSIADNAAQIGGGLYNDADSTSSLTGGVIQGNTAARYAPGVYNAGLLDTQGLRELSNGLYLENRGAAVYLSGELTPGTVIRLENSGYVTPNSTGAPIVVGEATPQYSLVSQETANGFQKPLTGFDGWEIRLSGDNRQVLLAPAEYALTYENTLGIENPNPHSYTVFTPAILLLPLADTPGFRFLSWFDAPEGGAQVTQIPQGSMGAKTLYARWQVVEYTVTYCGNDEAGPPAQWIPYPVQGREGQSVTLSEAVPTRSGYRFLNWNSVSNGSGVAYQPGQRVGPLYADFKIFAQWQRVEHTLTYHGNDEAGPPAQWVPFPQPLPEGTAVVLPGAVPTRKGFRFTGWNTRPEGGGDSYQPGDPFGPVTAPTDLYAQWIPLPPLVCCTLTYCGNDAGGPPACCVPCPQQLSGSRDNRIACGIPRRANCCFAGWNTSPCGAGETVYPGQVLGPARGDLCLFAQWRRLPPPNPHRVCRCAPGREKNG